VWWSNPFEKDTTTERQMMDNPWNDLKPDPPYVLTMDSEVVAAFNQAQSPGSKATMQTHLFPEPFLGRPAAPVYLLGLNPGFSILDTEWHRDPDFLTAMRKNLNHDTDGFPFLDPRFEKVPGSQWWRKRLRWLIGDTNMDVVSRSIFCVELMGYHSTRFKGVPKRISENKLLPSSEYAGHLVRTAIKENKLIVAMRSYRRWCKLVPELSQYTNVLHLNSQQNVSLSPANLAGYQQLIAELQ
jgi:hypothetical protein